jgi:thiol peroxidase
VLDSNNKIRHAEYVKEVADFPNYESALAAARSAGAASA